MTTRTAERRRSLRIPAAYPITVRDRRERLLARGRTANTSESGLFMIARNQGEISDSETVILEITLPAVDAEGVQRGGTRTVHYVGKIIRTQCLGQLLGLGIKLIEKIKPT